MTYKATPAAEMALCGPPYATIVIDPPWPYTDRINAKNRGAENHYKTIELWQIMGMPVPEWAAAQAHVYLWTTNAFVEEAYRVVRAWGFEPKTLLTWGKPGLGMGHYYRNNTEHVLFATRGNLKTKRKDMPTLFTAKRKAHSEKPQEFYNIVHLMSPGPKLDVFARKAHLGFDTWGDQCYCAPGLPTPEEVFR